MRVRPGRVNNDDGVRDLAPWCQQPAGSHIDDRTSNEECCMKGLFLDASDALADVFDRMVQADDPPIVVNQHDTVAPEELPSLLDGYDFVLDDHSALPAEALAQCPSLKHVIFLGTGARSYMDPEALAALGITVHIIKGYGDVAVAEHTVALIWAAARGVAGMDRGMRSGQWLRTEGVQLHGKTLGLVGFGGIAGEVARIMGGAGMKVIAWNRTPREAPGVEFVPLDRVLAESDVLSLHLLLTDETRGFLGVERLGRLRPSTILVNTARGALVDEAALIEALQSGRIAHAALDVFDQEPLPAGHPFTALDNVTLTAHSAFRTPEASDTLIRRALDIAKRVSGG
jgi:D-3-phosphoglycerate dehydrogenase